MAKGESTRKKRKDGADKNLPGKPEKLEQLKERLYMEISKDAIEKYKGVPCSKRRAFVRRYKIRRWSNTDLATLFSIDERTIERDLKAIRKQMWGRLSTDEGAKEILEEIYTELRLVDDEIVRETWQLYTKTSNDSVKLGCLKLIGERQSKVIEVMQSLGLIKRAPEELNLIKKIEIITKKEGKN